MGPYMLFDDSTSPLQMLASRSERMSLVELKRRVVDVRGPLNDEDGMDTAAYDRSTTTADELHQVTYLMFERLRSLVLNCNVY